MAARFSISTFQLSQGRARDEPTKVANVHLTALSTRRGSARRQWRRSPLGGEHSAGEAREEQQAAGCEHSLVVTSDGKVRAFGRGACAELGLGGDDDVSVWEPAEVAGLRV